MVARDVKALESLDIAAYAATVAEWTAEFWSALPGMELVFNKTPWKWKNDIRFFRVGMLQGFLGHEIGLRYIDQQKHARGVHYTNPSDLFLNGLIDTHQGTCANMPVLHVAISRKMGWPVSLACVGSHFISRFDDGEVVHNIEATDTAPGAFASGTDEDYIKRYKLPRKAITCGSDLRCLSMREMMGVFVALRARHLRDIGDLSAADSDYALARVLFPSHRHTYLSAMVPMLHRGSGLFETGEIGHPDTLPTNLQFKNGLNTFFPINAAFDPAST
jgi:hypothetical protein